MDGGELLLSLLSLSSTRVSLCPQLVFCHLPDFIAGDVTLAFTLPSSPRAH